MIKYTLSHIRIGVFLAGLIMDTHLRSGYRKYAAVNPDSSCNLLVWREYMLIIAGGLYGLMGALIIFAFSR